MVSIFCFLIPLVSLTFLLLIVHSSHLFDQVISEKLETMMHEIFSISKVTNLFSCGSIQ